MAQFWFNLPEIRSRLGMQYPLARLNEENFLRGMIESKTDMIFVIVLSDGNKPMGSVGIHGINPVHRFAELGIAIGEKEHRNEGYGTEATRLVLGYCFETLDLERVELVVMEDNLRAKKVYDDVGFVEEGVRRSALYIEGQRKDLIVMGMLASEWRERHGSCEGSGGREGQGGHEGDERREGQGGHEGPEGHAGKRKEGAQRS